MTALWPQDATRITLGDSVQDPFAMHLPARTSKGSRPVVLVHGFRGTAADWGPLADRLSRTRDVWAPDLITSPADPGGMPAVHNLLDRVRTAAGGGSVDVIASSMGGYVAVSWAATDQQAVEGLTLLAPALVNLQPLWRVPGFTRLIALQRALDADEKRWESELAAATAADFLAGDTPHHLAVPETWRQALLDHTRRGVADPAAAGRRHARQQILRSLMSTLRRSHGVARMLADVRKPVLWLHGNEDGRVPFGPSRDVATLLPDCTFERLEGVGHIPHLECPDRVADRIESGP